jgi:hypothetical protein
MTASVLCHFYGLFLRNTYSETTASTETFLNRNHVYEMSTIRPCGSQFQGGLDPIRTPDTPGGIAPHNGGYYHKGLCRRSH